MKLKIKVRKINESIELPEVIKKGDFIDLRAAETVSMKGPQADTLKKCKVNGIEVSRRSVEFDSKVISLGVAMKLPKGFVAALVPRSSTFEKYGIIQRNSVGIIDNSYCGNNDIWGFPAISYRDTLICTGDRICQFEIRLSQKATMWQKLKWMFCSGVRIVEVDNLGNNNRGGFGSTGIK